MNQDNLPGSRLSNSSARHNRLHAASHHDGARSPAWKYSAMIVVAAGAALLPLAAYAQSGTNSDAAGPAKSNDHSQTAAQSTPKKPHRVSHKHAVRNTPSETSTSPTQPDTNGQGNRNLGGSDAGG